MSAPPRVHDADAPTHRGLARERYGCCVGRKPVGPKGVGGLNTGAFQRVPQYRRTGSTDDVASFDCVAAK